MLNKKDPDVVDILICLKIIINISLKIEKMHIEFTNSAKNIF